MKKQQLPILFILLAFLWSPITFGQAKYIFLFIGDGMGINQVMATNNYLNSTQQPPLHFGRFPAQGLTATHCTDSWITDSGAAGTAIACGIKTKTGTIGMDANHQNKLESIAEYFHKLGHKIGIVTSVSIDHATPASFYAHQPSRGNYYEIAQELAQSGFEYFGGGGLKSPKGSDNKQIDAFQLLDKNHYHLVNTRISFDQLKAGTQKVIAIHPQLASGQSLPYALDADSNDISLAEFTRKGIELLDNETGFFMMVEGGKIDWACHSNDGATFIHEVIAMDEAIAEALTFYQKHPNETLIIVTADHETGGLSIGYRDTHYKTYFDKLAHQNLSYDVFANIVTQFFQNHTPNQARLTDFYPLIEKHFGLLVLDPVESLKLVEQYNFTEGSKNPRLRMALNSTQFKQLETGYQYSMESLYSGKPIQATDLMSYGHNDPFTSTLISILNHKSGLGWTTFSHTGMPVGTFAIGAGAERFNGFYQNSDIKEKIIEASQTKRPVLNKKIKAKKRGHKRKQKSVTSAENR